MWRRSRSPRRRSSRPSTASWRRWPRRRAPSAPRDGEDASSRPDIAELLPVERFGALLDLIGAETELVVAAEEELAPVLSDHWTDVCAAFGDEDAHHLYVSPERIQEALGERARIWLSALAGDQEIQLRAQSADTAARSLGEAEPELEKLVRSGYRTVVAFPRRGEGERAAYNLGRLKATWLGEGVDVGRQVLEPSLRFAAGSLREGFVAPSLKLAVFPEHRLLRRRRAERPGRAGAAGDGGVRRGALRSFTELRAGDIVVHEDHGVARFAGFETRTVANVTRDYLYLEYQGDDRVFVPTDQLAKISRYVGAGGEHPPLSKPERRRSAVRVHREDFRHLVGVDLADASLHLHIEQRARLDDQQVLAIVFDLVTPSVDQRIGPTILNRPLAVQRRESAQSVQPDPRCRRSQISHASYAGFARAFQLLASRARRWRNSAGVHRYLKALRSFTNKTGTSTPKRASSFRVTVDLDALNMCVEFRRLGGNYFFHLVAQWAVVSGVENQLDKESERTEVL